MILEEKEEVDQAKATVISMFGYVYRCIETKDEELATLRSNEVNI